MKLTQITAVIVGIAVGLFTNFIATFLQPLANRWKKITTAVFVGLITFSLVLVACQSQIPSYDSSTILAQTPTELEILSRFGQVLDSKTRKPIVGAKVKIDIDGTSTPYFTDSEGVYKFSIRASDTQKQVHIWVTAEGYIPYDRSISLDLKVPEVDDIRLDPIQTESIVNPTANTSPTSPPTIPTATIPIPTMTSKTEAMPSNEVLELDQVKEGVLADKQTKLYTFKGVKNTPLLIDVQAKTGEKVGDNFYIRVDIMDSKKAMLKSLEFCCGSRRIPFTPEADGQYTITVVGIQSYGNYTIVTSLLTEGRNPAMIRPLVIDQVQEGLLADKSVDHFTFTGSANTPLLIDVQAETGEKVGDNFYIRVDIMDSKKAMLKSLEFCCGSRRIPFTPETDGQYTITVVGIQSYGSYTLVFSFLIDNAIDRKTTRIVELGKLYEGKLAVGSVDYFKFEGKINTPLLIDVQAETGEKVGDNFYIRVDIMDSKKVILKSLEFCCGSRQISFIPPNDGDYIIEMISTQSYGTYTLALSNP